MPLTLYVRKKLDSGPWRWKSIREGKGIRNGHITGTFAIRPVMDGKQKWQQLTATSFDDARAEANKWGKMVEAKAEGAFVSQLESSNANRTTVQAAIDTFLEQKSHKRPKTLVQYKNALDEFRDAAGIRYIDEVTEAVLRRYLKVMEEAKLSAKTINTRMIIVFGLLKRNDVKARIPVNDLPTVEVERAKPFTEEELKKLWAYLRTEAEPRFNGWTEDELRYRFFLATGCRDQEVMYATWKDLDLTKGEFHVTRKPDVGFEPKSHESRTIPLPTSLVKALKEREKNAPHPRWIFTNGDSNPEGHFLDKLKRIALAAGLNCGHCSTTRTVKRYGKEPEKVQYSCKDKPYCEEIYLHRFRKTRATQWAEEGISVRTIQHYLGHESLETTQLYLGVSDTSKVRGKIDSSFGD